MITDYSSEVKIAIFEFVLERRRQISYELQHNFHFLPLLKNYWTDFHRLFTRRRAISVAINAHIRKAMMHSI